MKKDSAAFHSETGQEQNPLDMSEKDASEFKRRCWTCGIVGHKSKDCWENNNDNNKYNSSKKGGRFNGTCHYSKKKEHMAQHCCKKEEKYVNDEREEKDANDEREDEENIIAIALMTMTSDVEHTENIWIADSGATKHMTNNKDKMVNIKKCDNEWVMLGDGRRVKVEESGDILVHGITTDNKKIPIMLKDVLIIPSLMCNILCLSKVARKSILRFTNEEASMNIGNLKFLFEKYGQNALYSIKLMQDSNGKVIKVTTTNMDEISLRYGREDDFDTTTNTDKKSLRYENENQIMREG